MNILKITDIEKLLTEEDRRIFKQIEKIRNEYLNSEEIIEFTDYGARSPDLKLTDDEMYNGIKVKKRLKEICKQGMKGIWAQFLYLMIKVNKPKLILELGTCCGFSAIYMAKGYSESIIYTIEGAKEIAEIAQKNFKKASCKNINLIIGRFQDVLKPLVSNLKNLNFAFIDGHHDERATLNYFNIIFPKISKNGIIIIDDINWSNGMKRAWKNITLTPNSNFYDYGKIGIIKKI